jgi:DmsE family decaheme c-type cytochrome
MKSKLWWRTVFCGALLAIGYTFAAQAADDVPSANTTPPQKDAVCTQCHDETEAKPIFSIYQTPHGVTADSRTPGCQDCHGTSEKHYSSNAVDKDRPQPDIVFGNKLTRTGHTPSSAQAQSETCLTCHQGGTHINWQSSTHANRDVACTSCHVLHTNDDKVRNKVEQPEVCYSCHKEQRALMSRPSHHPVPEGEMACTSCHDLHNDNPKALIKSSTNDTCLLCHAEKRGPFIHDHQPVTEDCSLCHQPHGTTAPSLLRQRAPILCQQCHVGTSHAQNTDFLQSSGTIAQVSINGRACMTCHANIHGSNSPANGQHFRR